MIIGRKKPKPSKSVYIQMRQSKRQDDKRKTETACITVQDKTLEQVKTVVEKALREA
jgi:hypothetical protein